jgi:hypothetical protein
MTSRKLWTLTTACGVSVPQTLALKPWLKLILGFVLIWVCIFVFGFLAKFIPGARHMARVIDERNLKATAIYYTDLEESYEGAEYIRHNLEYGPKRSAN